MSDKKHKSIISPLKAARGMGADKSGFHHWWMQRVTAIALIPLTIWFMFCAVGAIANASYDRALEWLSSPLHAVLMILYVIATLYHAALGLKVVIEDYVHKESLKIASIFFVNFACFAGAVASIYAVLLVSLKG